MLVTVVLSIFMGIPAQLSPTLTLRMTCSSIYVTFYKQPTAALQSVRVPANNDFYVFSMPDSVAELGCCQARA